MKPKYCGRGVIYARARRRIRFYRLQEILALERLYYGEAYDFPFALNAPLPLPAQDLGGFLNRDGVVLITRRFLDDDEAPKPSEVVPGIDPVPAIAEWPETRRFRKRCEGIIRRAKYIAVRVNEGKKLSQEDVYPFPGFWDEKEEPKRPRRITDRLTVDQDFNPDPPVYAPPPGPRYQWYGSKTRIHMWFHESIWVVTKTGPEWQAIRYPQSDIQNKWKLPIPIGTFETDQDAMHACQEQCDLLQP